MVITGDQVTLVLAVVTITLVLMVSITRPAIITMVVSRKHIV
jgi:hypothetical protein